MKAPGLVDQIVARRTGLMKEIPMKIVHIDPRKLIVEGIEPPDLSGMEMIREDGLPAQEGVLPSITARATGEGYTVVRGMKYVRAVVALIEQNAECLDPRSGQAGQAAEVYRTVPVGLLS